MEICGGEAATTNNRMELTAAIEALSALKEPCRVTLTSDSKYLTDAITKGWVYSWKKKGWKKSDGKARFESRSLGKAHEPPRPSRCHVRVGEGARRTSVQRAVRRNGAERIRKVRRDMNEVLRYILISYIAVISLISAVVCIADKHNSKIKGRRRVP